MKLFSLEQQDLDEKKSPQEGKPIRIWMDGAFDMMHYGMFASFRVFVIVFVFCVCFLWTC